MTTYQPQPLDTSSIPLPVNLLPLLERIAQNTHEVWAAKRIEEGWTFGPVRDDVTKKHPSLVPYNKLSESEKGYDREMVRETLKATIALGYQIVEV